MTLTNRWPVVAFFCYFLQLSFCQNAISVEIEHKAFGMQYTPRGTVKISSQGNGEPQFQSISSWNFHDQLTAARSNSLYCIRTKAQLLNKQATQYVMSCIPSCLLVASDLSDVITVTLDSSRQHVVGLAMQIQKTLHAAPKDCQHMEEFSLLSDQFNTTIRLIEPIEGPLPETQAYLQKLEREKQEKVQGEQGDSRSFIAKYWMYIVPVVVIVMLSGAMNPEAGQQAR